MSRPKLRRYTLALVLLAAAVLGLSALAGMVGGLGTAATVARALAAGALLCILLWAAWRLTRRFLWRVRRRLAFSYFLIGVLPIPMVLLLALFNAYLLSGYFLGHLFRDAVEQLHDGLARSAAVRLAEADPRSTRRDGIAFGYYRDGALIAGEPELPAVWPAWLENESAAGGPGGRPWIALRDGSPTLAAAAASGDRGVIAVFVGPIEDELSRRSDVWAQIYRPGDPRRESNIQLRLGGRDFFLQPLGVKRQIEGRSAFFGDPGEERRLLDEPWIWWGEISGPLVAFEDGTPIAEVVTASLNGTPRTITRHLFSGAAEVNTAAWAGLLSITVLLSVVYGIAVAMALVIIFTLSRAVDHLSRATDRVQRGDFAARIPVRRRDQVGELQRSFNQMTASLETLVATAAQKELLEKELEIARELQKSLLPADLPETRRLEFATLFEPSAAIGGDYYDVLRIDERRLVVVVADVAGHGLPAGLRMAMLKAALSMLVEDGRPAEQIARRLSAMVRGSGGERTFVTATLGTVDVEAGVLELTNAGHPPTYLVREGVAREILLPGNPLGALGTSYGHEVVRLEPGDVAVWLSDGLIETRDSAGDPFGYERTRAALGGQAASAAAVRDRLLASVAAHADGRPPEDDRTLVAMRYLPLA